MAGAPIIYLTNALVQMRLVSEAAAQNKNYESACISAAVVPEAGDENSVVTLDAVRHVRVGPPSYTLQLTIAQDWSATGFCRWLYTNEGIDAAFAIGLNGAVMSADSPRLVGTCVLAAPTFGGEAETWIEADVEMLCYAKPSVQVVVGELTSDEWWEEQIAAAKGELDRRSWTPPVRELTPASA